MPTRLLYVTPTQPKTHKCLRSLDVMDALKNENLALSQARSATLTSCLLDALKNENLDISKARKSYFNLDVMDALKNENLLSKVRVKSKG